MLFSLHFNDDFHSPVLLSSLRGFISCLGLGKGHSCAREYIWIEPGVFSEVIHHSKRSSSSTLSSSNSIIFCCSFNALMSI
jgi:hypothetical protein